MRALAVVSLLALALTPACTTRAVTPGQHDTGVGGGRDGSGSGNDGGSPFVDANLPDTGLIAGGDCSAAAMQWIYLVDQNNAFLRYDPAANQISTIGTLHCPTSAMPFSMAVSRDAVAYVLYGDDHIYAVSTADASCTSTSFPIDQMGFQHFGMGFVSNAAGSTDETLFVAGGPASGIGSGRSTLGSIDIASWTLTGIGPLEGSPELTGNGLAELWGFFPDAQPMAVRQLDKTDGHTIQQYDVSSIGPSGLPIAWAFAFWGGRDYIFFQSIDDSSTGIYRLDPMTAAVDTVMADTGYSIVGAGVSTCAPTAPM